jgi:hypothetical protein
MAACALASARVRDGAVISSKRDQTQMAELLAIPAETFYAAAEEALPRDLLQACGKTREFEFLRACGLLAIASIQEGRIDAMQKHIGYYFTTVAIQNGHDEQFWPQDLDRVELEERRRLVGIMSPRKRAPLTDRIYKVLVYVHARCIFIYCMGWVHSRPGRALKSAVS